MTNNIVPFQPTNAEIYRASTDAANLCRSIVLKTAVSIQGRKYVKVEGWQAIAIAHGCVGSSGEVETVEGGVRAIGEVRRMSDGQLIARGEGFVGQDEPTWYGGVMRRWKWGERRGEKVWFDEEMPKRADYAIRAMAQTRAISRACRAAFAHVVVLIDENLSTTPAEEVPFDGFPDEVITHDAPAPEPARAGRQEAAQAPRPTARTSGTSRAQEPSTGFQRSGPVPAPRRPVDRSGTTIPAPMHDDPQDWQRWFRAVSRRLQSAQTKAEIVAISKAHAAEVGRGDAIIPGAAQALHELVEARINELNGKAA